MASNRSGAKEQQPSLDAKRGAGGPKEWRPDYAIKYAPVFQFPPQVAEFGQWLFGYPGYLWPWNVIYFAVCLGSHTYTTPPLEVCGEYKLGWIAQLYLRNLALLWAFAGGWHLLLYTLKVEGDNQKYDKKWQAENTKKFLFHDQVYDNIFWSCGSGVMTWTLYEAYQLHQWAVGGVGADRAYFEWGGDNLAYSVAWLLLIPIWREFHFYAVHRLIHVKFIYRHVHYLHHKNSNPGPWSGLAMHPVEHVFYFSVVLIHLVVPSHPIHFFFNAQHTALTPAGGHHGFEGPIVDGKIPTGSYFHYLHHRYFECNYGEATIPLDKWFGTFRDGQKAGAQLAEEHKVK